MKKLLLLPFYFILAAAFAQPAEFYELRIYYVKTDAQEKALDGFLKDGYLTALHKDGVKHIGVFKQIEEDTTGIAKTFVLTPYKTLADWHRISNGVITAATMPSASPYVTAKYDNAPYERMQIILLKAFSDQPVLKVPALKGSRDQRIYELRSYEGPTEKIFKNKVKMFNEGGEVKLFDRLGFNAVFYGEVIAGARMPNLMYMTTFDNQKSRDEHWKKFGEDPEWTRLKSMPEYQNNVSKIDIEFLRPTDYSDY